VVVLNAEISAAIQERLADADYGQTLARRGITTVALNDDGQIVEHRPDGSTVVVTERQGLPQGKSTPQPRRETARPRRRTQRRR